MKFIVRKAKLSDAKHIAIVHRSDNPYVTRFLMSGVDSPENLYRFGGAWMHEDSCAEHIMLFRVYGGEVFVAELDDRVVGHIEVIDDYNRRIGEYAYISVLVVHRGYRRRGIGRRLVRAVINYARDLGKDCVLVAAEEQSVGFYKKLGFEIEEVWLSVHIPAQKHGPIPQKIKKEEAVEEIVNNRYDPIIGRFHGTRMILFEFVMKYKTLEKLDMQHFFFKKSVGGCPIIAVSYTHLTLPTTERV